MLLKRIRSDIEWVYACCPSQRPSCFCKSKVFVKVKGRLSYVLFIGERVETPPNSSLQQSLQPLGFVHFLFSIKGPYAYLTLCHLELRAMGFDSGIWIDVATMTGFLMFPGLN